MRRVFELMWRTVKRPQISLFALLVLVAVSALLIHFVALPAYHRAQRKQILERIAELNGVWVDLQKEPLKRRLMLSGDKVDDPFLYDLADVVHLMPELTQLDLSQTRVSDAPWNALLETRSNIQHYVLFENAISEDAIKDARQSHPDLNIEQRRPDPVAAKLAMAPIPKAAVVSLVHDQTRQRVLIGTGDGRLHRAGLESDPERTSYQKHRDWLFDIAVSPSKNWIATGGGDNVLSIHRHDDLSTVTSATGHSEDVHGVVWLDNERLASTGDDRTLRLWKFVTDSKFVANPEQPTASLQLAATRDAHDEPIPRLIRIDSSTLITVSRDHKLKRWFVGSGNIEHQATYIGHTDDCMDVSVHPTGGELASVGYDGNLIVWDLKTASVNARFRLGDERLFALGVDWTNRHALVGSQSGLRLVELDTGRVLAKHTEQTFVSRVVRCGDSWLTSDGHGRIFQREPITLAPRRRSIVLESEYDLPSAGGFQLVSRQY